MTTGIGGIEQERIVIVLKDSKGRIRERWTRTLRPSGITHGLKNESRNSLKKHSGERSPS